MLQELLELLPADDVLSLTHSAFDRVCRSRGLDPPDVGRSCLELRMARLRYEKSGKPQRVLWESVPWFVWPTDLRAVSGQAVSLQGPSSADLEGA